MNQATLSDHLLLDAESLYIELREGVNRLLKPNTQIASVTSGGVWLAERLIADLNLKQPINTLSSALHRDDFQRRGIAITDAQTVLSFDVNNADILVLDDVLYTGRTIRAVMNELFDYGRPARIRLAVLVDRGGRQLPIAANFSAARITLPASQRISLARQSNAKLSFAIESV